MSWKDKEITPQGHQLAFKEALHTVSTDVFIKLAVPGWAMGATQRTRSVQAAFDELEVRYHQLILGQPNGCSCESPGSQKYMMEMIQERSASGASEKNDLFSNLLESNAADDGGNALTARELLG